MVKVRCGKCDCGRAVQVDCKNGRRRFWCKRCDYDWWEPEVERVKREGRY